MKQGSRVTGVPVSGIGESEGNHMTTKERIRIHVEIERENKRKLKEWKEGKA